ncbi:hypothetical protein [Gracilinema caldarium]|uniref:hypothetical protein n=1 Tax=Gracilinema caldarium TaxID=215591 RepID=UPI0026EAC55B|nr:hypothetical protein [Gracilinema caldarium]
MKSASVLFLSLVIIIVSSCNMDSVAAGLDTVDIVFELPPVPESWCIVLGPPCWLLEWAAQDGSKVAVTVPKDTNQVSVRLNIHQYEAFWGWPYWPEYGIVPYRARPAGALVPLDIKDRHCRLTWFGGVEAAFFSLLRQSLGDPRYGPEYFNWPRFRSLFHEAALPEEVLADPWCVDWLTVAKKTKASGFDRRRLVPMLERPIMIRFKPPGPWVSGSPFGAQVLFSDLYEPQNILINAGATVDTFLSTHGIIAYSWDGAAYFP